MSNQDITSEPHQNGSGVNAQSNESNQNKRPAAEHSERPTDLVSHVTDQQIASRTVLTAGLESIVNPLNQTMSAMQQMLQMQQTQMQQQREEHQAQMQQQQQQLSAMQAQLQQNQQAAAHSAAGSISPAVLPPNPSPEMFYGKPMVPKELVPTKAIEAEIAAAKSLFASAMNQLNRFTVKLTGLNTIDPAGEHFLDYKNALPVNTPGFVKTCVNGSVYVPKELEGNARLNACDIAVKTAERALQGALVSGLIASNEEKVKLLDAQLLSIRTDLIATVTAHLEKINPNLVSAEQKQQNVDAAVLRYDEFRDAEAMKIESKRISDLKISEEKKQLLEDAKLRQLETTSSDESFAAATRAVVRQELAVRVLEVGGEEMDEDLEQSIQQSNAVLTERLVNTAGNSQSKNGRATRAQKTQKPSKDKGRTPQKPQKTKQQKGKGGRGAAGATKAKGKGGRGAH